MFRHAFAGVLAIVLVPAALGAQTTLTIEASSMDVHESPKEDSRVVGQAPRGRVLEIMSNDGEWLRVVWPGPAACVGYVRVKGGALDRTDSDDEQPRSVRTEVDAVERAIWAIFAARHEEATALRGGPTR